MRRLLRRETFIALRARRQSYRIAGHILHPPMERPQPPTPAPEAARIYRMQRIEQEYLERDRRRQEEDLRSVRRLVLVIALLSATAGLVLLLHLDGAF